MIEPVEHVYLRSTLKDLSNSIPSLRLHLHFQTASLRNWFPKSYKNPVEQETQIVELNIERVRENAKIATTEDLLDRVTAFRAGLEERALEVLEEELLSRGIGNDEIRAHSEELGRTVLWESPGLALRCHRCTRPATRLDWRWHRLFGILPLFPRQLPCCPKH
jgi:hypothetical protein